MDARPRPAAAARALRDRAATAPGGTLTLSREDVLAALAPPPEVPADEADPAWYAHALLVQHGLAEAPRVDRARPGEAVRLAASPRLAVQGAVPLVALAAVVGLIGFWGYGLLFAATGALACALLVERFAWADRAVPGVVPRGRLLGAVVAAALLLAAAVLVALPVRLARDDLDQRPRAAAEARP